MGTILLFYKYTPLKNPIEVMHWQRALCTPLGLRGRIILATEGINATLGGTTEATDLYISVMNKHPDFKGIDFKTSPGGAENFPKLSVKVRDEIITLGVPPKIVTAKGGGTHLTPQKTHEMIKRGGDDFIILDARNGFESAVGAFTGAVKPSIKTFTDLTTFIDEHAEELKDKRVLMYCTGGIRCERATAYAKTKGIENVYQIEGGIHRYVEQYPDGFFRGKNYVFDSRIAVRINNDVLGTCALCSQSCDDYINCSNASCNSHFICCPDCRESLDGTCGEACKEVLASGESAKRPEFKQAHTP